MQGRSAGFRKPGGKPGSQVPITDLRGQLPVRRLAAPYPKRNLALVDSAVFHYTAGGQNATAKDIATYQVGPGAQEDFPAIAYHMHVDGTGMAAWCNDFDRRVWGSGGKGWNERGIHICFSGNDAPNEAQIAGLRAAYAFAQEQLGRPLNPVPHNATTQTACPGPRWAEWGPRVTEGFSLPAPAQGPDLDVAGNWIRDTRFSMDADYAFTFYDLWPLVELCTGRYHADPKILAGMIQQESTYHNYRVHRDGTGHGLLGYDDNGLLQDFENWSGLSVGRGASAAIIPVEPQLEFAARQLRRFQDYYSGDGPFVGARAWHAGGNGRNTERGQSYERLIRQRIAELFG